MDLLLFAIFLFMFGIPTFLLCATNLYVKVKNEKLRTVLCIVTAVAVAAFMCWTINQPGGYDDEPSWFDYHPLV